METPRPRRWRSPSMKRWRMGASPRGCTFSWSPSARASRGHRWCFASSMEIVLLFPGQGSQKPGMGKDLADAFPEARAVFDRADAALGQALSNICFEGQAEEI